MDLNIFLSLKSGITHFIAPAMWSGFAPFLAKVLYRHSYELAKKVICTLSVNISVNKRVQISDSSRRPASAHNAKNVTDLTE